MTTRLRDVAPGRTYYNDGNSSARYVHSIFQADGTWMVTYSNAWGRPDPRITVQLRSFRRWADHEDYFGRPGPGNNARVIAELEHRVWQLEQEVTT